MLMIDRIVLVAINEAHQMGEFECKNATRLECDLDAPHEVFDVRYMGKDIVSDQQVSATPVSMKHPRSL